MRSLHLLPHLETIDGIQRAALDLMRGLARAGDTPRVLTREGGNNSERWEQVSRLGAPVSFLSCSPRRPLAMLAAARYGRKLGRGFDVIVAHRLDLLNAGAIFARRASAHLVLHAHNSPPPWLRWNDLLRVPGSRRVKRIIVASDFVSREWRSIAEATPICVVELPIDVEHFAYSSPDERRLARDEVGAGSEEFVAAFVGRLEATKGPHVLLAAARLLHERGHTIRVLLQGTAGLGVEASEAGAYRRRCLESAGACPITWVPAGPDVRRTFAASDVCVVPSVWQEPSGLVVSEALATGTPVIASQVGGIPEQMPAGRGARLVQADDVERLVDELEAIRLHPPSEDDRQRLRAHVAQSRSIATVTDRYIEALTP
jgi:glycosyltransferase involved in cell wall biosynthesis